MRVSVEQYQELHEMIKQPGIGMADAARLAVCLCYNLTETQVKTLPYRQYARMLQAIRALEAAKLQQRKAPRFIRVGTRVFALDYNPENLEFRQYVEMMQWGKEPLQNLHLILASVVQPVRWLKPRKNTSGEHPQVAAQLLKADILEAYAAGNTILNEVNQLNKRFAGLYDISEGDDEQDTNDYEDGRNTVAEAFRKTYGWMYSVNQVAEYKRIGVDEADLLPVIEALNILAYIKAKANHDRELTKNPTPQY